MHAARRTPIKDDTGWRWTRRRDAIVHELIALVHRDHTEVIRCGPQDADYLPDKAFTMMWRMFELHTEAMVDHLADVLAPSMPLAP